MFCGFDHKLTMKNQENNQESDNNLLAIMESLIFIREQLGSTKVALTEEDRIKILKMGDSSKLYVEMVLEFLESNPEFISPLTKPEVMNAQFKRYQLLLPILREFKQLKRILEDEMMLLGADLMTGANNYYNSVNRAIKMGIPNATTIHEELRKRYAHKAKRKPKPEVNQD